MRATAKIGAVGASGGVTGGARAVVVEPATAVRSGVDPAAIRLEALARLRRALDEPLDTSDLPQAVERLNHLGRSFGLAAGCTLDELVAVLRRPEFLAALVTLPMSRERLFRYLQLRRELELVTAQLREAARQRQLAREAGDHEEATRLMARAASLQFARLRIALPLAHLVVSGWTGGSARNRMLGAVTRQLVAAMRGGSARQNGRSPVSFREQAKEDRRLAREALRDWREWREELELLLAQELISETDYEAALAIGEDQLRLLIG